MNKPRPASCYCCGAAKPPTTSRSATSLCITCAQTCCVVRSKVYRGDGCPFRAGRPPVETTFKAPARPQERFERRDPDRSVLETPQRFWWRGRWRTNQPNG